MSGFLLVIFGGHRRLRGGAQWNDSNRVHHLRLIHHVLYKRIYIYTHTHRTRCTVCSSISLVHFFSPHFFIIIIPIYLYDDDGCYTTGCLSIVIEPTLSWPLLGNTHQFDKPLANDTCFLAAVAMRMLRRRLFCVCVCVLSLDTTQSSLSSVAFLILCRI